MNPPTSARPTSSSDSTIVRTAVTAPADPTVRTPAHEAWTAAERILALLACLVVGAQIPVTQQIGSAVVLGVVLAPLWLRVVSRYAWGFAPFVLGATALVSGWLLTEDARSTHATSTSALLGYSLLFLSLITGIGVLLWARTLLGRGAATWFGLGLLAHAALAPPTPNLWKYTLSVPAAVLLLALAAWRRSRLLEGVALVGLIAVSALRDSRSLASMLVMALALVVWQVVRGWLRLRSTALRTMVTVALLGVATYATMQALILDGYLGDAARERTLQQLDASGTLITGGRPELGASAALIARQPWGYGTGTMPSSTDLLVAKSGMSSLNYDPNNGYVERYLFGQGYEVHSILGDLWIHFGIAGAVLGLTLVGMIVSGAASRIAVGSASALVLYVTVQTVWDQLFSPFYTESIAVLMLAVALTAVPRRPRPSPPSPTPPTARSGGEPPAGPDHQSPRRPVPLQAQASDDHGTQEGRRPVPVRRRQPLDDRPR
ncbi:MAG: O-antigen polymerase [Lapillicoccus sp.]